MITTIYLTILIKNVAGIAAQALLKNTSTEFGFEIEIKKGYQAWKWDW